ncbi:MAG: HD domain-containing protein [Eubacterium sp.]|jgi:response regulator RpfG family c-di-GMP phosphodiesterase|nr:HD domain-containing protein [Eubacterium sp.]
MMKNKILSLMKSIPFRVFIIVLTAGIIGIAGVLILKYNINKLSQNYQVIVEEHNENRIYMEQLSQLLYQHRSFVAIHVASKEEKDLAKYEEKEKQVREKMGRIILDFRARMTGNTREQIYHKVYSDYYSYLQSVDVTLDLSREGSTETAVFYLTGQMNDFLQSVNKNLMELEQLTTKEMNHAKLKMDSRIEFSRISTTVCIIMISVTMLICLVYCVTITSHLNQYKENLEQEIEQKNLSIRLHNEKMLSLQDNIIVGMANLIESRDGDTGEHIKRTSFYVNLLACALKERGLYTDLLTDSYIELLTKAAPMHDIGKIIVPDHILQKPGRLTPEEFETIKQHSAAGGRIVREVLGSIEETDYIEIAADMAAYHHEKWNGSGYVEGLSQDDIPLSARIMAIADVFDALVSKRCYKSAMPVEEAFAEIERSTGTHFDPQLVSVFFELKDEIIGYLNS